jgi:hypothetical protein
VAVMLVACSAVVAGAKSFSAIGQWASHAPQDTVGADKSSVLVRGPAAPREATVRDMVELGLRRTS